ncbi:MAG: 1-deoxy-D-xylulose-5-phosphate synthase, partial [Clostridia bacterium]|nr:1-deoxy-D-xylulose-5-phosphate synthase [Clostridia bacterium]
MAYEILDRIRTPEDLRALGERELNTLCGEIRAFLLEHVSKTGGHLASNLGIVETSVALCRVLDTARDRIIYDVGHQSYVHKILTDRREAFSGLRSFGGISGFMRPGESIHDPFVTGHASNAVSAALGLARAARLQGKSIRTVAVLGDGALTGGLAYEALNDAGASGERILVILNNNGMSIDRNVGALSRYLSGLRISPRYLRAKRRYHTVMEHIPGGRALGNILSRAKESFLALFLHLSFFEQMGFTCLGPMDGNDCAGMCRAIRDADRINGPVLLHIVTKKG